MGAWLRRTLRLSAEGEAHECSQRHEHDPQCGRNGRVQRHTRTGLCKACARTRADCDSRRLDCCYRCFPARRVRAVFLPCNPSSAMTTCLVLASQNPAGPILETDFEAAGTHVIGAVQRNMLVQEVVRLVPDLVVCHEASPDDALFDLAGSVMAIRATPLLIFCSDADAGKMARALECGVSAYVV